jgi:hypothetical protein
VTVTARDAFNNPVPGAAVVIASDGSDNSITQPAGPTNAAGVATGSFGSTTSELKTLSATANSVDITQTVTVNVVPDAVSTARSLVVASPTSIQAGSGSSTITVTARDINGNPVSGITVVLSSGDGDVVITQPGAVTDVNGEATGSVSATIVGTKTISATLNGATADSTAVVSVTAGAATQLVFTAAPSGSTVAGVAFGQQPVVTIQDANGNTVTSATDNVTLTLVTGSGVLSGTTTVAASGGIASFDALSLNLIGADKALAAASGALTPDIQSPATLTAVTAAPSARARGRASR